MNKKAQEFSLLTLFIIGIMLLILAPVVLKVISSTGSGLTSALNQTNPDAIAQGQSALDTVVTWFDYLIVLGFMVSLLVLLISAWFIDTHPVFLILYIILAFVLVLIGGNMLDAVDEIYSEFGTEVLQLTFTDFLRTHYMSFMVGIIVLSGIIMYAKFKVVDSQY